MQYALLVYSPAEDTDRAADTVPDSVAAQLSRPHVTGWARLHADDRRSGATRFQRPSPVLRPIA